MRRMRIAIDAARPDPRDAAIQEYLDKGDWKQALRLVEVQGRKDKSDKIFINKCLIKLVWSDDIFQSMEILKQLERFLATSSTPVLKLGMLSVIDSSMPDMAIACQPQMLFAMWERASNTRPRDTLLLEAWYHHCCRRLDFEAARKVALRLFKVTRDKHQARWRAIVACFLNAQFGPKTVVARVSSGLALALVKSSLDAIPSVDIAMSESASGTKLSETSPAINPLLPSVQTPTDLRTLLLIYKSHKMDGESLALLGGDRVGLRSELGKGIWRFALDLLKGLKKFERAAESWAFCYQLLCEAGEIPLDANEASSYGFEKRGDDLLVWTMAAENVFTLKDPAILSKFEILLGSPQLKKRHRLLAAIHLSLLTDADKSVFPEYQVAPITAIQNYLDEHFATGVAYDDLRSIAEKMPIKERVNILRQVKKMVERDRQPMVLNEAELRVWMHEQLTEMKLIYTLVVSCESSKHNVEKLESFAGLCVGIYIVSLEAERRLAITERRTGDEAAILGASTLLHLGGFGVRGNSSMRIRAILLLETLLENSPHHYGAMMMLIRLYVSYGCWQLAAGIYVKLDIKTIQLFSDAWVMTTRVATIFPYRSQRPNKDIGTLLSRCGKYAESKGNSIRQLIDHYETRQNSIGLCDGHMFLNLCTTSLTRATVLAELSRYYYRNCIGDCFGEETVLGHLATIEHKNRSGGYSEVRSMDGFPNYEAIGNVPLATWLHTGPMTTQMWVEVEDLVFKWRRWTQKREWPQLGALGHMAKAAECMSRLPLLFHAIANPTLTPGLTRQEQWIAIVITNMTAVQSVAFSLSFDIVPLKEANVDLKEKWLKGQYPKYERCFASFLMVTKRFMNVAVLEENAFFEDPIETFYQCPWDTLHTYYKLTEALMFIPAFLLDRISFAKELKDALTGVSIDSDNEPTTKMLDVAFLEKFLREFLQAARIMINNWNTAARKAQEFWRSPACIDDFVIRLHAHDQSISNPALKVNLQILFETRWATGRAAKLAHGWQESLSGIILEDLRHWRTKRWPRAVEQYMEE